MKYEPPDKMHTDQKEHIKLALFTNDMMVHIENPKESKEKT